MKKIFYVLLVLFVIIVFVKPDIYPVRACENQHPTSLFSDKEGSIICIDSKNIYDFNDNDPENITIPGHLYFPPNIDSPVSLIIISHGAGGIFRFHYDYKDMMLRHGYAVLIIDHFTPRDTIIDFTFKYVTEPMMVSDVINSAKILRTHPRLNGKIGYIGWSKGGIGPILLKNKHLYDKLVYKNDFEFLAGVYTYCGFDIDKENVTDFQIHVEHGRPLLFGNNNSKGLKLNKDFKLEIVDSNKHKDEVLIHDEANPVLSQLLLAMQPPDFPIALGIIRKVDQDTYDDQFYASHPSNMNRRKSINDIIKSGDIWKIS